MTCIDRPNKEKGIRKKELTLCSYVLVYVRGRVERSGSAIIMLIARNPTTCIYQVFLFSARVGVFHYTFPISYSDFWEGAGRMSDSGWG